MDLSPFEQNLQEAPQTLHHSTIQLFFTSNECFSHFNGQQLLSNVSHFVLFSQAHFKITWKTKAFEKHLFHLILLNFEYYGTFYTVQIFLERDLKIQKLKQRGRGSDFLFKKYKRGGRGRSVHVGP